MDEMERVNVPPVEGTCREIVLLCAEYDKLNNTNVDLGLNNYERIEKHQKVVRAIKRKVRYLNELIK